MDLVHLPEWTFGRKRISANSNPNLKAQKRLWEIKMTSFFGKVSRYPILCDKTQTWVPEVWP